jgi:hypothetical protein
MKGKERCPTCKHPVVRAVVLRVCCQCGQQIKTHDKWTFVPWRGRTVVRHRNCDEPTAYVPDLACKAVKAMRRRV